MKRIILLVAVLSLSTLAFGQGAQFKDPALSTQSEFGVSFTVPLPGASIYVCTYPASGGLPCTNKAQVCTDQTLASCSNSAPMNPVLADSNGNFNVFASPGAYDVVICPAVGACQGPYHYFVPVGYNVTAGSARLPNYFDVLESTAPANPTGSVDRFYMDSGTHKMKCLTSSGGDCTSAGGGGGISLPVNAANAGNFLQDNGNGGIQEAGSIGGGTSVAMANVVNPSAGDNLCYNGSLILVNCTPGIPPAADQTGAGYSSTSADCGTVVPLKNAVGQTATLPATVPTKGCWITFSNLGAGTYTLSGNGNNIDDSAGTISLPTNNSVTVYSRGTDWVTGRGIAGVAGGGGSVWSALTNPVGSLSLSMAHFQSTFTYDGTTGAGANLFNLTDTSSNTGTGALLSSITASGSAAFPILLGVTPTTAQTATALVGLLSRTQTAADSTHNYYSPQNRLVGRYWTGAADADDIYGMAVQCAASGSNPSCPMVFTHVSGTSGVAGFAFSGTVNVGGTTAVSTPQLKITTSGNSVGGLQINMTAAPTQEAIRVNNSGGTSQFAVDKNYNLVLGGSVGQHVNTKGNGDFVGTCTFAAATTCSITYATAYTGTPVVILTPVNPGAITFTLTASSNTGFTITASSSNSLVVNYVAFGNGN